MRLLCRASAGGGSGADKDGAGALRSGMRSRGTRSFAGDSGRGTYVKIKSLGRVKYVKIKSNFKWLVLGCIEAKFCK